MSGKRQKVTPGRRFDVQALRDIAGGRVFDRGQAYQSDGRVEIAALDGERVIARIRGTETYRATLEGSGRRFSGECTCPAFFDFGFCKHLVAAALAANALSREDAREIGGRFARLRNYLRMQGVEALVERLVALAERDPVLLEDLELASSVARGDDQEILSRFRDAVADAVSTGGYVEYAEAGGWASGIEDVLERIGSLAATGKAAPAARRAVAFRLMDHYLGLPEQDWNAALKKIVDAMVAGGQKALKAQPEQLRPNAQTSIAPAALAGVYADPWYGTATVSMRDGKLWMRFDRTPRMEAPLVHVAGDTYEAAWTDKTIEAAYVTFAGKAGKVVSVEMRPVSPLADFSFDYRDLHFAPAH